MLTSRYDPAGADRGDEPLEVGEALSDAYGAFSGDHEPEPPEHYEPGADADRVAGHGQASARDDPAASLEAAIGDSRLASARLVILLAAVGAVVLICAALALAYFAVMIVAAWLDGHFSLHPLEEWSVVNEATERGFPARFRGISFWHDKLDGSRGIYYVRSVGGVTSRREPLKPVE